MFDPFFCDEINGFDLSSSEYPEEDDTLCSNYRSVSRNSHIDRVNDRTTYDVYGIELRETKKAILYQLVVLEKEKGSWKRKFKLGPEKWLPKAYIGASHVSEFDATDEDFAKEFVVTGIDNLHVIGIPSWLYRKDAVLREKVFSVKKFKG